MAKWLAFLALHFYLQHLGEISSAPSILIDTLCVLFRTCAPNFPNTLQLFLFFFFPCNYSLHFFSQCSFSFLKCKCRVFNTWNETVYLVFYCCAVRTRSPRYRIRDLHNHELSKGRALHRLILKILFTNQYSFITYQTGLDASMENYKNLEWCFSIKTPSFTFLWCSGNERHRQIFLVMLSFISATEETNNTNTNK